jgi:hypothetical protein
MNSNTGNEDPFLVRQAQNMTSSIDEQDEKHSHTETHDFYPGSGCVVRNPTCYNYYLSGGSQLLQNMFPGKTQLVPSLISFVLLQLPPPPCMSAAWASFYTGKGSHKMLRGHVN